MIIGMIVFNPSAKLQDYKNIRYKNILPVPRTFTQPLFSAASFVKETNIPTMHSCLSSKRGTTDVTFTVLSHYLWGQQDTTPPIIKLRKVDPRKDTVKAILFVIGCLGEIPLISLSERRISARCPPASRAGHSGLALADIKV